MSAPVPATAVDHTTGEAGGPSERPGAPSSLEAKELSLAYDKRLIVEELDLAVPTGRVTAIVGPNGCGKSTLLRGLSRLLPAASGQVLLEGQAIGSLSTKEVARRLGLLPQQPIVPEGITVVELVERGRHPHHGLFKQWSREDETVVAEALEMTELVDLAGVPVDSLSGGQRQRAWIAMALAQRTPVLLLDEPTSFLDIAHQIDVLELVRDLNAREGTTVVMVLHDLAMAARYADHLVAMSEGAIVAEGAPADIVTPETIESVFGIAASVVPDPTTGDPVVIPHRRKRDRS